ncbi:MAG: DNA-directed RNA polymerase subunit beta [Proteobacteria bacterium]|nr:DNA-directed RNA polymerase subunit beta [Pseudomonadota bacterium]
MNDKLLSNNYRHRRSFAKTPPSLEMDNLIEVQIRSFREFIQEGVPKEDRKPEGLQSVFQSVFPITDYNKRASLEFESYELQEPQYDVDEYRERALTYHAQLKVTVRLDYYDEEGIFEFSHSQEVYFGEFPLMTQFGTFIINGTERVVVSQLHRSPGVFFDYRKNKTGSSNREILSARIIPNRGSWIDFEFDARDVLQVRIDRRKKITASMLLRGLDFTTEEIVNYFHDIEQYYSVVEDGEVKWYRSIPADLLLISTASRDYSWDLSKLEVAEEQPKKSSRRRKAKSVVEIRKGKKFLKKDIRRLKAAGLFKQRVFKNLFGHEIVREYIDLPSSYSELFVSPELKDKKNRAYKVLAHDLVDPSTGEIIAPVNTELTEELVEKALEHGISQFDLLFIDGKFITPSLHLSLLANEVEHQKKMPEYDIEDYAVMCIFSRIRPNDPHTPETARQHIERLLFNSDRYDLSKVGRIKVNERLYETEGLEGPEMSTTVLNKEDIFLIVHHLFRLKSRRDDSKLDDIDHLGNRRVRSVGELLENQFRIGLVRMEKAIKEKMNMNEVATMSPNDIINSKPVAAVIKEFFGASQLSQFMDQTNPLSEVTHKRRLSALGPGGLTRERAGNEVRDVHTTHYGRICPVETPEGPNVGLIASLASYARINEYGFIETPYREVLVEGDDLGDELDDEDGLGNRKVTVTEEIKYFSALKEQGKVIVQAETDLDENNSFVEDNIVARKDGELRLFAKDEINLMDVSPNQMVSVAASLVPFLEHDDANRALMGSNMQRQAVPLIKTRAPLVGTGMEKYIARDSGVTQRAKRTGRVTDVDATRIVIEADNAVSELGGDIDIYRLTKYRRSNQNTCFNQTPLVSIGDHVEEGDIIADGPATDIGELALGQNPVVAFMPWQGYNFEDSILISERLVREDVFTSIHIEEFEVSARDTKLGKEEITCDIPNVGEDALKNLDPAGIIRVGAYVKPGDILVGKTTPKGEQQLSPEQKLLRAIFGEKAGEVKDTSLRARTGVEGVVISAQVFTREGTEPDVRSKEIAVETRFRINKDKEQARRILRQSAKRKITAMVLGKTCDQQLKVGDVEYFSSGEVYTKESLDALPFAQFDRLTVREDQDIENDIWDIMDQVQERQEENDKKFDEKLKRLEKGDELLPGVIKRVVVYIAIKRKLQVGDKMAGRHGNKGVVSRVMAIENMPYLEDGTPVDVVLNPLGVPSRMNVGQILETHLGWAARGIGLRLNSMLDAVREQQDEEVNTCRELLLEVFKSNEQIKAFLKTASPEELARFSEKYNEGLTVATPVFSGAPEEEIKRYLRLAQLDDDGRSLLFDGRTGEPFENRVTVGVMYILKLHHLVDEKIHARSIGPYSLVTQQPLGGKAQFGGQRLGEMEVWALEAYGAAYSLQEFLTVKSDDVAGRTAMYDSIVKGENFLKAGLPESFNVLIKELHSLALDVELIEVQSASYTKNRR